MPPITLPTWNADDGRYHDVEYFDAREVARRLHVSVRTVTRNTTEQGRWPHIKVVRRPYLSEVMIGRVVELMTHDPDGLPDLHDHRRPHHVDRALPRLGRVLSDDEIEAIE